MKKHFPLSMKIEKKELPLSQKEKKTTPCPFFEIPIAAGFPSPADDPMQKKLDLNEHLIDHPAATFFIQVTGDSMKDANIYPGDLLIVDRSLEAQNGSIVVACLNGEFTLKRILFENNTIFLQPENPHYKKIQIQASFDFEVWGVVRYIIHKAR